MKHSYLVLLVFIAFSTSQVYALSIPETGVQSTNLENTQNSQATITESSESESNPNASTVTDTVTEQSPTPVENMFHQVVDWLYPTQKEEK